LALKQRAGLTDSQQSHEFSICDGSFAKLARKNRPTLLDPPIPFPLEVDFPLHAVLLLAMAEVNIDFRTAGTAVAGDDWPEVLAFPIDGR
jgi:hypothetical protein